MARSLYRKPTCDKNQDVGGVPLGPFALALTCPVHSAPCPVHKAASFNPVIL